MSTSGRSHRIAAPAGDGIGLKVVPATLEVLDAVIVASNLFGDVLSDLVAALAGGLGLAPSANLNRERVRRGGRRLSARTRR